VIIGTEGALLLLALALYLFDAAVLLAPDEWLVEQQRGKRWRARFGLQGWPIARKEPWLPNPLAPWRPLLRLHWRFEVGPEDGAPKGAAPLAMPGTALRVTTGLLLVLIFVALPIALLGYPLLVLRIGVAVAIYATCVASALVLWRSRGHLGLTRGECAKLAVECVVCPPFALNLVRKLGLRQSARVGSGQVLAQLLGADERATAKQAMLQRLHEQMDFEPEGSARMAQLQAVAVRLEQESP